ncbi:MAG: hypothetical protein KBF88_00615 [Polyangiaceae bacterium]|nr:hypothetical protein [Polyangiaceae bacterium]
MPENRPNSVSPSGSGIGESKSMLVELADLKAQLEGFTTFAACVEKKRNSFDPTVADTLAAAGYAELAEDACHSLEAVHKGETAPCTEIKFRSARDACIESVAAAKGNPDLCPFDLLLTEGRSPKCIALALRDPRFCEGALLSERLRCRAAVMHDPSLCKGEIDALAGRSECLRAAGRWRTWFAAPEKPAAFALRSRVRWSRVETSHAADGGASTDGGIAEQPNAHPIADVVRGVVLVRDTEGVRFVVGTLREAGGALRTSAPREERVAAEILVTKDGWKIKRFELELPGSVVALWPEEYVFETKSLGKERGEPVEFTLRSKAAGPNIRDLEWIVKTYIRDVSTVYP